jgi:S-adenosylmethionine:tRNA ribosyltransferase-isomerase
MKATASTIQFELPQRLACPKPTEERGIARDQVRLLVTTGGGEIDHVLFRDIDRYLVEGDVLVVNLSATRPSAFRIPLPGMRSGVVHFSNKIRDRQWLIEIREIAGCKTIRWKDGKEGLAFQLPEEASITLKKRFYGDREQLNLWIAEFHSKKEQETFMAEYAQPIQYDKINESYPLDYYQTFFSVRPGSAEMPSAGRPFTQDVVENLLRKGVVFARILLHTGVSSLEEDEVPYPEYMELEENAASIINKAKKERRRIIAVGTTAVRAVESAVDEEDKVVPYKGNTDLFIGSDYRMKIIDGVLTGFHEPRASHLHMLQSLAGFEHIERAYQTAIASEYYWHQFGDMHLILPAQ